MPYPPLTSGSPVDRLRADPATTCAGSARARMREVTQLSILRAARREVAGAWRSLRYDIGHRPGTADSPADGYPDVTSGGLSTFGGPMADGVELDPYDRPPRRLLAASALGALALAGAAGSYLAVVNGLGTIAANSAARPPEPLPLVAEPARTSSAHRTLPRRVADTNLPPVPVTSSAAVAAVVTGPTRAAAPEPADPPAPLVAGGPGTGRPRPVTPPVPTPCRCPVPTPASSPTGGTSSYSPSASTAVSPSPSASPSPSVSAIPTESFHDPRGRRTHH